MAVGRRPNPAPTDGAPSAGEPSDEYLVTEAQHDRAAFALLYRRYATAVYRYCDRALGDRMTAEEVTQTVFLRALTALPNCRDGRAFRPWLFAIAHNAIADARRARRPFVPLDGALDMPDLAASPEEVAFAGVQRREITTLLARLPDQERAIIELRLAGLRDKEIAQALGRSVGAIRTAQYRAVNHLRALLIEREQEVRHVAR
jgi:RNA polymerase sigma-70 factor (ECF subfamily)